MGRITLCLFVFGCGAFMPSGRNEEQLRCPSNGVYDYETWIPGIHNEVPTVAFADWRSLAIIMDDVGAREVYARLGHGRAESFWRSNGAQV